MVKARFAPRIPSAQFPHPLAALLGLTLLVSDAWAESFSISRQPDRTVTLQLQGKAARDYALETTTDLGTQPWERTTIGGTDGSGRLEFTGRPDDTVLQQFYRVVELTLVEPTTTTAIGLRNNEVVIKLGASDPAATGRPLLASIAALPTHGQLLQFDGTPITTAGTRVTDSQNRVRFVPEVGASDATFSYTAAREGGAWTPPQAVSVSLVTPAPSEPTTPRVHVVEDATRIFALTANDPNPAPGGGALSFIVDFPPLQGRLYQVAEDNVTQGALILSQSVTVTNPNHLVMYVPKANVHGQGYETLTYRAVTSRGGASTPVVLPFDIESVNDAPVALATNPTADNTTPSFSFTLNRTDQENDPLQVYFTELPARGVLKMQGQPILVGQPYDVSSGIEYVKPDDGSYLGAFSFGAPYTQFSWYVRDPSGATSAPLASTIAVTYLNTPPMPTGPNAINCPPGSAEVVLPLTSWDVDGDEAYVSIESMPAHGSLFLRYGAGQELPITSPRIVPGPLSDTMQLLYRPDPTQQSGQPWTDTFTYFVIDDPWGSHGAPLTFSIFVNTSNSAPTISSSPTLSATVDAQGAAVQPAKILGFSIHDDSYIGAGTPSARQLRVTLRAVQPLIVSSEAAGQLNIDASTAGRFAAVSQPSPGVLILTGSEGRFNQVFAAGNITYTPAPANRAGYLQITVEDQGWTDSPTATPANLSQTAYLPISYSTSP